MKVINQKTMTPVFLGLVFPGTADSDFNSQETEAPFPRGQMKRSTCSSLEDQGAEGKSLLWLSMGHRASKGLVLVVQLTSSLDQEFKVIVSYSELEDGLV